MIGGIVSGIGAALAGFAGASATKKAAKMQLQATQETNATNYRTNHSEGTPSDSDAAAESDEEVFSGTLSICKRSSMTL